jgi:tRNA-2-methylthio-N6-dimethylallyladenosine synthase
MAGKSPWLQAVQVEDEGIGPGEIARVRLVEQAPNSFFGEVVGRMSEIAA